MTTFVVDTSALVAVALDEPDCDRIIGTLGAPSARSGIGAPTLVELGTVLTARLGEGGTVALTGMPAEFDIAVIPFTDAHWRSAVDAFGRFGRGRHPASRNFGDCLTYATARAPDAPLLFVGEDFSYTDLVPASGPRPRCHPEVPVRGGGRGRLHTVAAGVRDILTATLRGDITLTASTGWRGRPRRHARHACGGRFVDIPGAGVRGPQPGLVRRLPAYPPAPTPSPPPPAAGPPPGRPAG